MLSNTETFVYFKKVLEISIFDDLCQLIIEYDKSNDLLDLLKKACSTRQQLNLLNGSINHEVIITEWNTFKNEFIENQKSKEKLNDDFYDLLKLPKKLNGNISDKIKKEADIQELFKSSIDKILLKLDEINKTLNMFSIKEELIEHNKIDITPIPPVSTTIINIDNIIEEQEVKNFDDNQSILSEDKPV